MSTLTHRIKSNLYSLMLVLILTGTSGQKTVDSEGSEWLPVNFYGTIIDTEGNKDTVQNISISGEYRKIPFYIKPKNPDKDPASNYEKLDLADIAEIKLATASPADALYSFKKRDYIEIIVTFNKKVRRNGCKDMPNQKSSAQEKKYIIERSKQILSYVCVNNKPILKIVNFESLSRLIIKGFKEQTESDNNTAVPVESSEEDSD